MFTLQQPSTRALLRGSTLPLLLAALLTAPAQAGLYKWVDAEGNVHYGDRPPPNAKTGHTRYNAQGVAVESQAPALTAEQREAAERTKREAREAAERESQRRHRDRVLLETFTTERDLLLARDDRIGALDAAIALSSKHQGNWQTKLDRVEAHIADIESQGQNAPQLLLEERDSLRRKISSAEDFTAQKMVERSELSAQFEADIQRYRQLKHEQTRLMEQLGN